MTLYSISLFITPHCSFPLCCFSLLIPLCAQLHLQKYHKLYHFFLVTQSYIIVGAYHKLMDKNVVVLLSTYPSVKEGKRLFLLLHMADLDISSLSSFISRTPTDFKRRSVYVGREQWSQDPPMKIRI